jgi:hypothetical protein
MVLIVGRKSATRRQQKNHADRQGIGELQALVSQALGLLFPFVIQIFAIGISIWLSDL